MLHLSTDCFHVQSSHLAQEIVQLIIPQVPLVGGDHDPLSDHGQRRDVLDPEGIGQRPRLLGVNSAERQVRMPLGCGLEHREEGTTGWAPWCPEIEHGRLVTTQDEVQVLFGSNGVDGHVSSLFP